MKIGILTQPISSNYGGILQNYALQTILTRMGHEVETLNWNMYINEHRNETFINHIIQIIKTFISRYFLKRTRNYYWEQKEFYNQLSSNNKAFIYQHIKLSKWLLGKKQFRDYAKEKHFDALIVGSDQTWRPLYNKNNMLYRMFFDFAAGWNIRRIAYAASFGVDVWEYSNEETTKCSKLLQVFDAVSVREFGGMDLCKRYLNTPNVKWVLDPTLLLNPNDYESLFTGNKRITSHNKTLTTYILDNSTEKQRLIYNIAEQKKCHITEFIPKYCNLGIVTTSTINDYKLPSVVEWLQAFQNADYVVSDSFHGTIFCIIFNKPFVTIGNRNRGYDRFSSLLSLFNLEKNLVDETVSISEVIKIINTPINWYNVNEKRQTLKQQSMHFLENALN